MKTNYFSRFILIFSGLPAMVLPLGIDFSPLSGISYTHSYIKQEPYENWQKNYFPQGGSMSTHEYNYACSWDLGLQAEIQLIENRELFSCGIPVTYAITFLNLSPGYYDKNGQSYSGRDFLTLDKTIAGISVDWWNKVPVHKIRLRKTSPAIGFSVKRSILKSFVSLQLAVQRYSVISENYQGVDKPGDVNTAQVIYSTKIENGWGWRVDAQYSSVRSDWRFGLFYERDGRKITQSGFSIGYYFKD